MSKLKSKTPITDNKDLPHSRESIKNHSNINKHIAEKSVKKLEMTDKEKIASGEYEWVLVTPQHGKSYKALKRKL